MSDMAVPLPVAGCSIALVASIAALKIAIVSSDASEEKADFTENKRTRYMEMNIHILCKESVRLDFVFCLFSLAS